MQGRDFDTTHTGQVSSYELSHNPATVYYLFDQRKVTNGLAIFAYATARLLGCLFLLSLSLKTLSGCPGVHEHGADWDMTGLLLKCPEVYMTFTYVGDLIIVLRKRSAKYFVALRVHVGTWINTHQQVDSFRYALQRHLIT